MASIDTDKLRGECECPVCFDTYDSVKKPLLTCEDHRVCAICVRSFQTPACPECRAPFNADIIGSRVDERLLSIAEQNFGTISASSTTTITVTAAASSTSSERGTRGGRTSRSPSRPHLAEKIIEDAKTFVKNPHDSSGWYMHTLNPLVFSISRGTIDCLFENDPALGSRVLEKIYRRLLTVDTREHYGPKKLSKFSDIQIAMHKILLAVANPRGLSKDHPISLCALGDCYRLEIRECADPQLIFSCYERSAKEFDPAVLELAKCYERGVGVERDQNQAFQLYTIAYEKGVVNASYYLGMCYLKGWGVKQDKTRGIELIEAAPCALATWRLARCYERGYGVFPSSSSAVGYYRAAREDGLAAGMYDLARCYRDGIHVDKCPLMAEKYFAEAHAEGYPPVEET